jgi:choline dehydrogenase
MAAPDSVTFQRGGQTITAHAKQEIILAAGAINSPQILQRSGIGPGQVMQQAGVEVIADRPGGWCQSARSSGSLFSGKMLTASDAEQTCESVFQRHDRVTLVAQPVRAGELVINSKRWALSVLIKAYPIRISSSISCLPLSAMMVKSPQMVMDSRCILAPCGQNHAAMFISAMLTLPRLRKSALIICHMMMTGMSSAGAFVWGGKLFPCQPMNPFRGDEIQPGNHVISDDAIDDFIREHA